MKRVLLLTDNWPPAGSGGGVQRPIKFAKYLRPLGFDVSVLAPEIDSRRVTLDPSLLPEVAGIPCHRVPLVHPWVERLHGTPRRLLRPLFGGTPLPDPLIATVGSLRRRARELHARTPFQLVLSTSPPHSLAVAAAALKTDLGVPWVADLRDEWSRNRLRTRRLSPRDRDRDRRMERESLAAADRVVATTVKLRDHVAAVTGHSGAAVVITNGFDTDDLPASREHAYGDRMVFVYLGTMSSYRNLDTLFDALRRLGGGTRRLPLLFRFLTPASRAERHFAGAVDLVRDGVIRVEDYLPHRRGLDEAARADVLLHVLSGATEEDEPVAGKLFEYLALRRPVLFLSSVRGENSRILEEAGAGSTVDIADVDAIMHAIRDLHRRWERRDLSIAPRSLEAYDRRNLAARLAAVLEEVLA